MSSSSLARQNRRMRQRQLPVLNLSSSAPLVLSPNALKSSSSNSGLYEVAASCSVTDAEDKSSEDIQNDSATTTAPLPSTTGCSFINCDVSSRPVGKVFIEEERGFKVIDANHMQLFNNEYLQAESLKNELAITMAYKAAKVFQNFSQFCHGLLGGMSLIHMLLLIHLITTESLYDETLKHFSFLSQPVHNIYNFVCMICCVSAFDRFDIGNVKNLIKNAKKYQLNVCIILIYPMCLLLSLSTVNVDEKLWLPNSNSTGWETFTSKDAASEIFYWKTLSILKCAGAVLAWMLLCWNPNHNLFLYHLKDICKRNTDIQ